MPSLKTSILAIAAVAAFGLLIVLAASQSFAADLGGNCCADLEERVAELEATTARKGNKKVSVVVTGVVDKALFYYDVPGTSDAAVIDNSNDPSRLTIDGSAKISPEWSAGYVLQIGVGKTNANVSSYAGFTGISSDNSLYTRQSYAYLTSPVGTVSLGLRDNAAYNISAMTAANTLVASKMLTIEPVSGIKLTNGPLSATVPLEPFNGFQDDVVRFDSKALAGFVVSGSWASASSGYDIALTWAGDVGQFRGVAGIAYEQNDDDPISAALQSVSPHSQVESKKVMGSASVMHMPTGLFVSGAYGRIDSALTSGVTDAWEVQGGIENKFVTQLGKTTIFAEYADWSDANLKFYGGGVVQNFEASAFDLFATVRRYDLDSDNATTAMAGARIKF